MPLSRLYRGLSSRSPHIDHAPHSPIRAMVSCAVVERASRDDNLRYASTADCPRLYVWAYFLAILEVYS